MEIVVTAKVRDRKKEETRERREKREESDTDAVFSGFMLEIRTTGVTKVAPAVISWKEDGYQ